jgi:DNA-binding transcriptional ArsR family regulator
VLTQFSQSQDLENAGKGYAARTLITPMEHLAEYFKVFSEPNRLAVLEALRNGPLNVTAVVDKTGLSQALVSKHLKLLTIAGVVQRRPQGSLVFYEVNDKAVFKLMAQAEKLMLASRRQQLNALAAIL